MLDEQGEMLQGWENVSMPRGIEQTDVVLMEAINSLNVEEAECSCECHVDSTEGVRAFCCKH